MTEYDLSIDVRDASRQPVVKLCDLVISGALVTGASAIQLLQKPEGLYVRYQIKGDWRDQMTLPLAAGRPLINRVRVMANLDRTSVPRPHAGEIRCLVSGREYYLTAEV